MMHHTTRRDLLRMGTSAAACGALVGGTTSALATTSPAGVLSAELASAFEQHRTADAALERFYRTTFNPAVEAHNKLVLEHRAKIAAVPHVQSFGPQSMAGTPVTFSSSKSHSRAMAEAYLKDGNKPEGGAAWNETVDAARQFIKLDDERNARIAALGPTPEEDPAIDAGETAACAPLDAARKAIHAFPVRCLTDLKAKLDWIERDNGMDGEDLLPLVMADVARLARGGAS